MDTSMLALSVTTLPPMMTGETGAATPATLDGSFIALLSGAAPPRPVDVTSLPEPRPVIGPTILIPSDDEPKSTNARSDDDQVSLSLDGAGSDSLLDLPILGAPILQVPPPTILPIAAVPLPVVVVQTAAVTVAAATPSVATRSDKAVPSTDNRVMVADLPDSPEGQAPEPATTPALVEPPTPQSAARVAGMSARPVRAMRPPSGSDAPAPAEVVPTTATAPQPSPRPKPTDATEGDPRVIVPLLWAAPVAEPAEATPVDTDPSADPQLRPVIPDGKAPPSPVTLREAAPTAPVFMAAEVVPATKPSRDTKQAEVAVEAPAKTTAEPASAAPVVHTVEAKSIDAAVSPAAPAPLAEVAMRHRLDLAQGTAWLDQLTRDIVQTSSTDGKLSFRLNPDALGSLGVEVRHAAEGAHVRMTTDTEQARAIIADAQPRLIQEARAQGLRIADAQVDLGGRQADAQRHQQQQHQPAPQPMVRTAGMMRGRQPTVTINQDIAATAERYA